MSGLPPAKGNFGHLCQALASKSFTGGLNGPLVQDRSPNLQTGRCGPECFARSCEERWAQAVFQGRDTPCRVQASVIGGDAASQQVPAWLSRPETGDTSGVGLFMSQWPLDPGHRG